MSIDLAALTYRAMIPSDREVVRQIKAEGIHAYAHCSALRHVNPWIHFDFRPQAEDRIDPVSPKAGWKIHLSVDVADIDKAWDSLLPLALHHSLTVKVMGPQLAAKLGDPGHRQAGKTIVIYTDQHPQQWNREYWTGLLTEFEETLITAGIRPGWLVRGDRPVPGAAYAHIRSDQDPAGNYISGVDAYNPFAFSCPFDGIALETGSKAPEPVGTSEQRCLRLLDFISPGWQRSGQGAMATYRDVMAAADAFRAFKSFGFPVHLEGRTLSLSWLDEAQISARWHDVMEVRRAAEIGRIIQAGLFGEADLMTIARRRSADAPTEIRITFDTAARAQEIAEHIDAIPLLGNSAPRAEGEVLCIPYAGRFHTMDGLDPHWLRALQRSLEQAYQAPAPSP